MQESVTKLCTTHENFNDGLKVLNVGFGLGIVRYQFSAPQVLSTEMLAD